MNFEEDTHAGLRTVLTGRLWVPLFTMVGISILSGSVGIQVKGWSFVGLDKLAHFLVFGLLGLAWVRCLRKESSSLWKRFWISVGLTTLFGLADEFHQAHNPLRTFEWADAAADFAGALFWVGCYLWIHPFRNLMEVKFGCFPSLRSQDKPTNMIK
jgi:hypothetical protein